MTNNPQNSISERVEQELANLDWFKMLGIYINHDFLKNLPEQIGSTGSEIFSNNFMPYFLGKSLDKIDKAPLDLVPTSYKVFKDISKLILDENEIKPNVKLNFWNIAFDELKGLPEKNWQYLDNINRDRRVSDVIDSYYKVGSGYFDKIAFCLKSNVAKKNKSELNSYLKIFNSEIFEQNFTNYLLSKSFSYSSKKFQHLVFGSFECFDLFSKVPPFSKEMERRVKPNAELEKINIPINSLEQLSQYNDLSRLYLENVGKPVRVYHCIESLLLGIN